MAQKHHRARHDAETETIVRVKLICRDLPGIRGMPAGSHGTARAPVFVGIQKGKQVVDIVPGDRPLVTFDLSIRISR